MAKKNAMPVSKATNAYELLDDIKALALEEPKRISMDTWRSSEGRLGVPPCGTVGCIGGWVEALVKQFAPARHTLGLDDTQTKQLFFDDNLCNLGLIEGQTARHARRIVTHINRFQKQHEAQLKAHQVTPDKRAR
jgi:hypothetical protein